VSEISAIEARVEALSPRIQATREHIASVLVGQKHMVDRLLIGLLADGHVLLEGAPGLAKTTAVKALASAMHLEFSRIQFTPDLLPADLIGTQIYQPAKGTFTTRKGPVFANIVLADEINRAPAKVQAALLESMQERQVTLGETTWNLPKPFLVLATQNPIDQEGTYPLPEAQTDRFLLKVHVDYPSLEEELQIVARSTRGASSGEAVATEEHVLELQALCAEIHVSDVLMRYIVDLVRATRTPSDLAKDLQGMVEFGASPRASIGLAAAARAHALLEGRAYALPDDVRAVAFDVLRHRVMPTYQADAQGRNSDWIVRRILELVPMP